MPSNDDLKHQNEGKAKGPASGDVSVASVLPDDRAAGADETSINETSAPPLSSDHSMPQEFIFFQKKKRADHTILGSSLAYVSAAQLTTFAARLDSAVAVNAKTQRHIAELMALMSDVARTMTKDTSKPTLKRLRRSKWLFYGCLAGFSVGWFVLFPSGHSLVTQIAAFLAK